MPAARFARISLHQRHSSEQQRLSRSSRCSYASHGRNSHGQDCCVAEEVPRCSASLRLQAPEADPRSVEGWTRCIEAERSGATTGAADEESGEDSFLRLRHVEFLQQRHFRPFALLSRARKYESARESDPSASAEGKKRTCGVENLLATSPQIPRIDPRRPHAAGEAVEPAISPSV